MPVAIQPATTRQPCSCGSLQFVARGRCKSKSGGDSPLYLYFTCRRCWFVNRTSSAGDFLNYQPNAFSVASLVPAPSTSVSTSSPVIATSLLRNLWTVESSRLECDRTVLEESGGAGGTGTGLGSTCCC